jgi:DNA-binding HxlR family transcriptional regulator
MARREAEHCPVARALEVVGEKWTLLILRDLLQDEACRFQQLQESLAGIAPNTLSARLKTLEANGVIDSRFYSKHPPRPEYFLTKKGKKLGPVVLALYEWGMRYEMPPA